jgi:hypothetical protein
MFLGKIQVFLHTKNNPRQISLPRVSSYLFTDFDVRYALTTLPFFAFTQYLYFVPLFALVSL